MAEDNKMILEQAIRQAKNNNIISLHWATLTIKQAQRMVKISQHALIKYILLDKVKLESGSIKELKFGKWDDLLKLKIYTSENNLNEEEFEDLTSISMKNLKIVELNDNSIDEKHCLMLAGTDWPITNLNLSLNMIYSEHCKIIAEAHWKMEKLNLSYNSVDAEGVSFFAMAGWQNLTHLKLNNNQIGQEGCKIIVKAEWKYLKQLDLENNRINEVGCAWLGKGQWENLTILNVSENQIGWRGISNLAVCEWPKLIILKCLNDSQLGYHGINRMLLCEMNLVKVMFGQKYITQQMKPYIESLIYSRFSDSILIELNLM